MTSNQDPRNVNLITQNDLCISCGACKHACPYQEISIKLTEAKGLYEPVIANTDTCLTCEDQPCLQVCPSYEEDFVSLANWSDPEQRIGPAAAIYTGYSTNRDIHVRASSGGITRELCRYYLESGRANGIITLNHMSGLDYEPYLYTSVDDLNHHMPGSVYHNINFEKAIEILKTTHGKFVLIGSPCQLTGIRKWQQTCGDQLLGEIEVTIGFICGWMYSRHTVSHFARYMGINYEALKDVTYRGGDSIGNFVLKDSTGSQHSYFRRPQFLRDKHTVPFKIAFSRTYATKRCLLCVEHLNFLADIVVGDAWLERFRDDKVGTSIVVIRNPDAISVFNQLVAQGRVDLTDASEDDVIQSQGEYFAFSAPARQIISKLKAQGKFAPLFRLPYSEQRHPTFGVWYKNHLNPAWFRYLAWRGLGYPWFLCRVTFLSLLMPIISLLKMGRQIARKVVAKLKGPK